MKPVKEADFKPHDPQRADTPTLTWDPDTKSLFYSWKRADVKLECLPGWTERKGQGVTYCVKPVPCPPEVKVPSAACGPSTVPFFKDYLKDAIETTMEINKCWPRGGPDVSAWLKKSISFKASKKTFPNLKWNQKSYEERDKMGLKRGDKEDEYEKFKAFGQKFGIDHRDLWSDEEIKFVTRWVHNFGERFEFYKDEDSGVVRRNATSSGAVEKRSFAHAFNKAKKKADFKTATLTQCVLKCKFMHYRAAETYFLGNRAALNGQKNCIPLEQPSGEITADFMAKKTTTPPQKACLKAYRAGLERVKDGSDDYKKKSWPGMMANKKPLFADAKCEEGSLQNYEVEATGNIKRTCQNLYDNGGTISVTAAQEAAKSLGDEIGKEVVLMDGELQEPTAKPIADCMGAGGHSKDQANTKADKCMQAGAVACQFHCSGRFQRGGVNKCIDSCFSDKGEGSDIGLRKSRLKSKEIKSCISAIKRSTK